MAAQPSNIPVCLLQAFDRLGSNDKLKWEEILRMGMLSFSRSGGRTFAVPIEAVITYEKLCSTLITLFEVSNPPRIFLISSDGNDDGAHGHPHSEIHPMFWEDSLRWILGRHLLVVFDEDDTKSPSESIPPTISTPGHREIQVFFHIDPGVRSYSSGRVSAEEERENQLFLASLLIMGPVNVIVCLIGSPEKFARQVEFMFWDTLNRNDKIHKMSRKFPFKHLWMSFSEIGFDRSATLDGSKVARRLFEDVSKETLYCVVLWVP